jgi:Uma2 family endonuclease
LPTLRRPGPQMANRATDPGPNLRMSRDEYRQWAEQRPTGRFVRVDGVVVAMAPERLGHADRKALLWLSLRQAIASAECRAALIPMG